MGRYITTIGLRPEVVPAYLRIKETEGNFSEWISNHILQYSEEDAILQQRLDAMRRQVNVLKSQFKRLYDHNGVVRREVAKQGFESLENVGLGDL